MMKLVETIIVERTNNENIKKIHFFKENLTELTNRLLNKTKFQNKNV